MQPDYLISIKKLFAYYKKLGESAMSQVAEEKLFFQPNEDSNSIAIIVQHLSGNMLSRWTDFLTSDGEKEWRDRDSEFETVTRTKSELTASWDRGWKCLFDAIDLLTENDLEKIVYIRHEGHTVLEAINRQLAHSPIMSDRSFSWQKCWQMTTGKVYPYRKINRVITINKNSHRKKEILFSQIKYNLYLS